MSRAKIWRILREQLKWKAYRPHTAQVLSEANKAKRLAACQWFIEQPIDFFEKQVIFSDEKYFVLRQGPNKQTDRFWAPVNPHELVECKEQQGGKKAMCWCGMVDGRVLGPFWVEGSMDSEVYRIMLEDHIWPSVKGSATRKKYFFQQDGATCHTTTGNLNILKSKFNNRIISNKTDISWPPKSPDMNPLDYFFWGHAMSHVYRCKPETLDNLKDLVDDFARDMDKELVRKVCRSFYKRAQLCIKVKGGHFEHLKSQAQKMLNME